MTVRSATFTEHAKIFFTNIVNAVSGNFKQAKVALLETFKSAYSNVAPKENSFSAPTAQPEQFSLFGDVSARVKHNIGQMRKRAASFVDRDQPYLPAWGALFSNNSVRDRVDRLTLNPKDIGARTQLEGICSPVTHPQNFSKLPFDLQEAVKKVLAD